MSIHYSIKYARVRFYLWYAIFDFLRIAHIVGVSIQWFVSDGNGKTECNLRNEKWMRFISRRIIIKFHRWRLTLCGIFYLHAYLCHQNKFKWGCINMFIQRSCDIWLQLPWPIISVRCVPIVSVDTTQRALCAYEMNFFNICLTVLQGSIPGCFPLLKSSIVAFINNDDSRL